VPHALESLPPVDFVLISHNHYDHLDLNTIRKLGPRPTYYVPLGLKQWFNDKGACSVPAQGVGKVGRECVREGGGGQRNILALLWPFPS
jgi:L-ascorbate metabolism protein UlaG (beta-lactamase superfamily)